MKSYLLVLLPLFSLYSSIRCQSADLKTNSQIEYQVETLVKLPSEISETSGIIIHDSLIWTINDSGGEPELYGLKIDKGSLQRKIVISNAKNIDWEDVAQNNKFICIGDIGNNEGSRTDLRIYLVPKAKISDEKKQQINAEVIEFSYNDQNDFTPSLFSNSFDCEAMISIEDSIFLFTKDWVNQKTSMYSLPAKPGNYMAKHISDFNSEGLITGADIDIESGKLVLCGYTFLSPFLIVFENYKVLNNPIRIELKEFSGAQVEGILIMNINKFLISNENSSIPQSLHSIVMKKL